jgi:hypothetical protein
MAPVARETVSKAVLVACMGGAKYRQLQRMVLGASAIIPYHVQLAH